MSLGYVIYNEGGKIFIPSTSTLSNREHVVVCRRFTVSPKLGSRRTEVSCTNDEKWCDIVLSRRSRTEGGSVGVPLS